MLCDIWSLAAMAGLVPLGGGAAPVGAEGSVDMALLPERPPETEPGTLPRPPLFTAGPAIGESANGERVEVKSV